MPETEPALAKRLEDLRSKGVSAYHEGNIERAIELIEQGWGELPLPKEGYAESFHFAKALALFHMKQGNLERAQDWAIVVQKCDMERADFGERELLLGQVAYERGQLGGAKRLLTIAHERSKGRLLQGKDLKYIELIGSDGSIPTFEELRKSANTQFVKSEFAIAKDVYFDCLNFEEALDDHQVLLRKGQCHFELKELEAAADSLARAYMLAGAEAFKQEDPKYLRFLESRMDL